MATITIYVSRNGNSFNLKLRDSLGNNPGNDDLTTNVSPGDQLVWSLDPNGSNLTSLNGVNKTVPGDPSYNANSMDLIAPPGTYSQNGSYYGTVISPSPGNGKFEKYKIGFMVPGDSTVYWDDPKLQMQ
jgi:hypothetical protein